jgi:hypothetical protein
MTQRVLPALPTRTMLSAVARLGGFSSMSVLTRRALCGVLCFSLALLASPAAAQGSADPAPADQGGWFEPAPDAAVPEPYYAAPEDTAAPAPAEVPDNDPSALTAFRPALDPYGNWVSDPTYGTVWVPHAHAVGADFAPYVSRGHWALTADDDWIWVSDYPFGWAVFHYGRWVWISGHGWSWVPGRTYANAWVVWRVPTAGYAYVGWAPMPPSWVWVNGFAVGLWYAPPVPYVFCHSHFVFAHHVHRHIVHDRHHVHRIASHTRVHPTPYHSPARPRVAASPSVRPAAPPPSAAPRGPRLTAARVPPSAVPAQRAAPPASAVRLSGTRRFSGARDVPVQRSAPATVRSTSSAAQRLPAEARRPATTEVRRSTPSSSAPSSSATAPTPDRSPSTAERVRSSSPERVRYSSPERLRSTQRVRSPEPRSLAPARARPSARPFTPSSTPVRSRRRP